MTLSAEGITGRQDEMDRLRRIWRGVVAQQKALGPEQRAAQEARWRAEARAQREAYHAELRALLDRQIYPVDVPSRLRDAGVEPQHIDGLRRVMDERPAFAAARRWWSQPREQSGEVEVWDEATERMVRRPRLVRQHPFLVLAGGSGIGKSQAATWCVREAVRAYPWNQGATGQENSPPFDVWHGAALAATALYGNHGWGAMDDAERQWVHAERAIVLVLDDLFPQRASLSKPHHDRLTRLITARHSAQRATILTVNMDTATLADLLDGKGSDMGGPLFRRIVQAGHVVTFAKKTATTMIGGRA